MLFQECREVSTSRDFNNPSGSGGILSLPSPSTDQPVDDGVMNEQLLLFLSRYSVLWVRRKEHSTINVLRPITRT